MFCVGFFFFQAEDGIRDLVRSRGLGDVYKRQVLPRPDPMPRPTRLAAFFEPSAGLMVFKRMA